MTYALLERAHAFPGIELELPVLSIHVASGPVTELGTNTVPIEPTVEALLGWLGGLGPVSYDPVPLFPDPNSAPVIDDLLEVPLPSVDEIAEMDSRGISHGFGTVTGTVQTLLRRRTAFGLGEKMGGRLADLEKVWFDRRMPVVYLKAPLTGAAWLTLRTVEGETLDGTSMSAGKLMNRMTDFAETIARVEESCAEIGTGSVPSRRMARRINQRPNRQEIIGLLDEGVTLGRKIESAIEALLDCRTQPRWKHPDPVLIETGRVFSTVLGARQWLEGTIDVLNKWNRR